MAAGERSVGCGTLCDGEEAGPWRDEVGAGLVAGGSGIVAVVMVVVVVVVVVVEVVVVAGVVSLIVAKAWEAVSDRR